MKNSVVVFISLLLLLAITSCQDGKKEVIAEKIQYDVNIKSPNPNYDWWIQNLVGPQREKLVKNILQGVVSGKFKVYDYFFQPLSKQEVADVLTDTIAMRIKNTSPPYTSKDTLIVEHIDIKDIQRLRFLEEWSIRPKTMQFSKTVIGIAPVARRIDAEGKIQWQPLFWIIPNAKIARKLQQIQ